VVHHGLDLRDPDQAFSAAEFVAHASRTIEDIHRRGKHVLLVGGTGMYLKALQEGWDFGGVGSDVELRATLADRLATVGLTSITADLLARDPSAGE